MRRVLAGGHGAPVTSEHVLGEGLTLLRRRPGREGVSRKFAAMVYGDAKLPGFVRIQPQDGSAAKRAVDLHFQLYERGLSFTDCALVVLARDMGAPVASFDSGFDGLVERISQ